MATRRRLADPTGPQPVTQVIASPVDTTVTPGAAGAPAAPTPLAMPVEEPQGAAIDLANLAQSFGALSGSLSNLGNAIARRERSEQADLDRAQQLRDRAEALRRRQQADSDREAAKLEKEAKELADKAINRISLEQDGVLTPINKLKPQFDKYVEEGKMYLVEHPAFTEAFSVGLAQKYARLDTEADALELKSILAKQSDEILNPNYFSKWYSKHTDARTENMPDWIADSDAFINVYNVTRGNLSVTLRRNFMKTVGEMQKGIEAKNLTDSTEKLLNSAIDPNDLMTTRLEFDPETLELTEVQEENPLVDPVSIAVGKIEEGLSSQRAMGVALSDETATTLVGKTVLNWIDSVQIDPEDPAAAREAIEFGLSVLKSLEVGQPGQRTAMFGDNDLGREFRQDNGVEESANKKLLEISEAEEMATFNQGVALAVENLTGQYFMKREQSKLPTAELVQRAVTYLQSILEPTKATGVRLGSDYYMSDAVAAGMTPEDGHWPSRIDSGPNEGMILKKPDHPTFHKTLKGEKDAGMKWYYRPENERYYTFPKDTDPGDGYVAQEPSEQEMRSKKADGLKPEDQAFADALEALNASFDATTQTLTFTAPDGSTITKTVPEIAAASKTEIIRQQFAQELMTVKSKTDFDKRYQDFAGEPLPDSDLEMIALARVVRRNNFSEEDGLQAYVTNQLFIDPGEGADERARSLAGPLFVYQELVNDSKSNPTIAKKVLGDRAYRMLQIVDALKDQYSLPVIARNIQLGRLNEDFITDRLTQNEGQLRKDIDYQFATTGSSQFQYTTHSTSIKGLKNFYYKDGPSALFKAKQIASILVAGFDMPSEKAAKMAADIVTKDAVKVGDEYFQPEMFSESVLTGSHPDMVLNPIKDEKNTLANQAKKLKAFTEAKKAYDDHYSSFINQQSYSDYAKSIGSNEVMTASPGAPMASLLAVKSNWAFTTRKDGTVTYSKAYRQWRSKLFDLENKLLVAEGKQPKKAKYPDLFPNAKDLREMGDNYQQKAFKEAYRPSLQGVTTKFSNMKLDQMMSLANKGLASKKAKIVGKQLYAHMSNFFEDLDEVQNMRFVPDGSDSFIMIYKDRTGITNILTRKDQTVKFSLSEVAGIARNVYHSGAN